MRSRQMLMKLGGLQLPTIEVGCPDLSLLTPEEQDRTWELAKKVNNTLRGLEPGITVMELREAALASRLPALAGPNGLILRRLVGRPRRRPHRAGSRMGQRDMSPQHSSHRAAGGGGLAPHALARLLRAKDEGDALQGFPGESENVGKRVSVRWVHRGLPAMPPVVPPVQALRVSGQRRQAAFSL